MQVTEVPVDDIQVRFRLRNPSDLKVKGIADSIEKVGLISPITLDSSKNLVCGFHRLLAHKELGRETIPCIINDQEKRVNELIELEENVARNELNIIQQSQHIVKREKLLEDLGLTYKRGDNRYTHEGTKLTIGDLAASIGLSRRSYELRKQVSSINTEVQDLLIDSDFADSLTDLVKLSKESDDVQLKTVNLLISGKTSAWKNALYHAKVDDFKLKTTPLFDFKVCERFGTPRSIMKFNPSPTELSNVINLVNHDEKIRNKKSETRFGITDVRLHQMNPDQCHFSLGYYTNPNDLILDPFSGRATTAITSLYLQRRFIGFELNAAANQKTREVIQKHMDVPDENWKLIDGDGCDMHYLKDEIQILDGVFTSPPYYNKAESYSDDPRDLCNMSVEQFDERIDVMFSNLKRLLKKSDYEKKIFHPAIFTVGTARRGKDGIIDMTHTFQRIAKEHDFTFWDQCFMELNNPHLVQSLTRNYQHRFVNKNYESQIVFVRF